MEKVARMRAGDKKEDEDAFHYEYEDNHGGDDYDGFENEMLVYVESC